MREKVGQVGQRGLLSWFTLPTASCGPLVLSLDGAGLQAAQNPQALCQSLSDHLAFVFRVSFRRLFFLIIKKLFCKGLHLMCAFVF